MESRALRFAAAARALGQAARAGGFETPAFRSPPRVAGSTRTVRRHRSGSSTVAVLLQGRPWLAVVADMVEGFVAVNAVDAEGKVDIEKAQRVRDTLWQAVSQIDLGAPGAGNASRAAGLRLVDRAA